MGALNGYAAAEGLPAIHSAKQAPTEETAWALEERSDNAELSISSETCNIVLLKYTTANHDVELDFPGREVKVGSNV